MWKKFVWFCFVGGTSFLIDIGFFNLFLFSGLEFFWSRLWALVIVLIYNFSMNRNFTFKASNGKKRHQIPKYAVIYSISTGANFGTALLLNQILGPGIIEANIATIVGILVGIPISFLGSLFWTFKSRD